MKKTLKFVMKTGCVSLCYSIRSEILNLNWTYIIMPFFRACSFACRACWNSRQQARRACWLFTNFRSLQLKKIWGYFSSIFHKSSMCENVDRPYNKYLGDYCENTTLVIPRLIPILHRTQKQGIRVDEANPFHGENTLSKRRCQKVKIWREENP